MYVGRLSPRDDIRGDSIEKDREANYLVSVYREQLIARPSVAHGAQQAYLAPGVAKCFRIGGEVIAKFELCCSCRVKLPELSITFRRLECLTKHSTVLPTAVNIRVQ